MSGRLSEGPAAIAEAAFRSNVREAVAVWRDRLAAPGGVPRECAAIGREAAELRQVAETRGWWALAQHLGNVENLSREAPASLLDAVGAIAKRLAPSEDPQAGHSSAPPPHIELHPPWQLERTVLRSRRCSMSRPSLRPAPPPRHLPRQTRLDQR